MVNIPSDIKSVKLLLNCGDAGGLICTSFAIEFEFALSFQSLPVVRRVISGE